MRNVGTESRKTFEEKLGNGFFFKYMYGKGLEIGYKGYTEGVVPILEDCIGVDLYYPQYDGKTLPFPDSSQDYVYSSHTLEHVDDWKTTIQEWWRVTKSGGHIVIVVPHQWLYEKKGELPSRFNSDHKRFYQASTLLKEIESSLQVNTFRIRHLCENDEGHVYTDPPEVHGRGLYEIEVVVQKL